MACDTAVGHFVGAKTRVQGSRIHADTHAETKRDEQGTVEENMKDKNAERSLKRERILRSATDAKSLGKVDVNIALKKVRVP